MLKFMLVEDLLLRAIIKTRLADGPSLCKQVPHKQPSPGPNTRCIMFSVLLEVLHSVDREIY